MNPPDKALVLCLDEKSHRAGRSMEEEEPETK
jgi:hypothetical protein